jgi:hypothetical protein
MLLGKILRRRFSRNRSTSYKRQPSTFCANLPFRHLWSNWPKEKTIASFWHEGRRWQVFLIQVITNGQSNSLQYPDKAYRIPHFPEEFVIVPHKCIEEIKNAPESKLSFQQGSYEFFLGIHTGITGHEQAMAALIRRDVGRLLDRVYSVVENEALNAVMSQIGPCEGERSCVLLSHKLWP